jgi:predicted kinase
MRKWMRDRLKGRKKEPEKPVGQAAAAPLQPAFYDIEPRADSPEIQGQETEPEPQEPMQEMPTAQVQSAQPPPGGDARKRRRRRGGRGRKAGGAQRIQAAVSPGSSIPATGTPELPVPLEPAATPAATPVPSPRPSRGTVVLAIGLPGSGKSAWFKRHNITPLSSDLLRSLLFDDPTEQRFQDLVFSNLRSMLKARLIARRPMNYVDATNLTSHDRQGWIKLAKDYGYDVQAVFFDVPLEVCLERNRRRERVVGEDVVRRMAGKLKPPAFEEGFSKITVVRVKQKE